jgi:hypothetical protein
MKPILLISIFGTCLTAVSTLLFNPIAGSQIPPVVDAVDPNNTHTAAISQLKVRCQDLKTVVQKEDRQAVMIIWKSNYFGREFTNNKRCQVVSERLQRAASLNGGTFQGLELASGVVNSQTVICALQNGNQECNPNNMLFTLNPKNANNPEYVIQQIMTFAEDGTGMVNESTGGRSIDVNLGNWERKAFGNRKSAPQNFKKRNGF